MISAKECLHHAARCEYMANISRDPESKTNWGHMAKRWIKRARSVDEPKPMHGQSRQQDIASVTRPRFGLESIYRSGTCSFPCNVASVASPL
jgi:hypothetical protein